MFNYFSQFSSAALLTVHGLKFNDTNSGINICCTSALIDLSTEYGATITRSENLTTFMQEDSVIANLGFVTNTGYTFRYRNAGCFNNNKYLCLGEAGIKLMMMFLQWKCWLEWEIYRVFMWIVNYLLSILGSLMERF